MSKSDVSDLDPAAGAAEPSRRAGINAVERALGILDLFIASEGPKSLAELSKASGLVKPTVLRCLVSLEHMGYVVRSPSGGYVLGAKVMQLGRTYRASFRLDDYAVPILRELAQSSGESASFHVREHDKRLCLFRIESPQSVRDFVDLAIAFPIDDSSMGMILSGADEGQDNSVRTVFSSAGVRNAQTASMATAVLTAGGGCAGAIALTGPVNRFTVKEKKRLLPLLSEAADRLSTMLGGPRERLGRRPRLVDAQSSEI
ncbi:IclR family transcriptional regulator [Acuticoccus mangrovi]|uniref:Helix-turn-helix domain-containing protein n=1 Tax=Acuticoccus mangrovi TaxID=2796142 RepID=A0A934IFP1_9HYPH|nr:helix-turn-helix domain-containing protein [Acuticoccus mangrovi]